jgi:hypothetical protein
MKMLCLPSSSFGHICLRPDGSRDHDEHYDNPKEP